MKYYHNPRCSKSRQGLELLKDKGIEPEVIEYLKTGISKNEFLELIKKTKKSPLDGLIRIKEAKFKELNLTDKILSDTEWAGIINENPVLLERPILVNGAKAQIGRPPEDLLKIL